MYWPICLAVPSAVFSAILPVKPSVTNDVDGALAEIVAFDEAVVAEVRQVVSRSTRPAALTSSRPLISSTPTLSRPTVGVSMSNTMRAIAAPITARSIRCCASAPIVAPTSSTIDSPRIVGHIAASAGRSISGSMCRQTFAIAISAPVLPAETAQSASPFFTASIGAPHRGHAAAVAQRLARLVGHLDRDVAMHDAVALAAEPGMLAEQRRDQLLVAVEQEARVGTALLGAIAAAGTTTLGP